LREETCRGSDCHGGEFQGEGGNKKVHVLDGLLKNLKLHGEELNEVILGKEYVRRWPEVKWPTVTKVLTRKSFSMKLLKNTMLASYNPVHEIMFHELEPNLFVIQAHCLDDSKRIMDEGPWLFCGYALMTEPFYGATIVSMIIPDQVKAWIQIHKILSLFCSKVVLTQLATRVVEVIMVEEAAVQTMVGFFHRFCVKLDANKPLTHFVSLTLVGRAACSCKFSMRSYLNTMEHCGLMGHTYLEYGMGEFEES
jgi:hypothetical protein